MSDPKPTEVESLRPVRWPVKRARAEMYLIISITVFAATVILTRSFLELTGYPQIGNGVLHIAHALWGGLLLIIAALLPLILGNEWALTLSAVLSGLGVGLFIDEVGKFITQRNDYFFPPAAPVIYGFFMILLLLLLAVRKARRDQPRNELYRALGDLREVIDNDLDAQEWQVLCDRVAVARQSDQPQIAGLAAALQTYLGSSAVSIVPVKPGPWQRFLGNLRQIGQRVGRKWHRRIIIAAMALVVASTMLGVLLLLLIASKNNTSIPRLFDLLFTQDEIAGTNNGLWFYLRIALELLVSALAFIAVILLIRKRERAGFRTALIALLLSLTGGTLLAFYLDQFKAVTSALYQLLLLLMVVTYQRWYLDEGAPSFVDER